MLCRNWEMEPKDLLQAWKTGKMASRMLKRHGRAPNVLHSKMTLGNRIFSLEHVCRYGLGKCKPGPHACLDTDWEMEGRDSRMLRRH